MIRMLRSPLMCPVAPAAHAWRSGVRRCLAVRAASGSELVDGGSRQAWQRADLHVVLVHPCIPQNAGNVARTCSATAIALHLVAPLGFELDSTKLKRAGLDYWEWVNVAVHEDWDAFHRFFLGVPGPKRLVAFSKLGKQHYAAEGTYSPGTWLMFGAETTGLPEVAHTAAVASGGEVVKIPMANYQHVRSLNLATSVGIGVFEALRQLDGATLPEDLEGAGVLAPSAVAELSSG